MQALSLFLATSPLILIFVLLIWRRMAADIAGAWGLALTFVLAILFFDTPVQVTARAALSGAVGSLPVGLVIAASIFQITVMAEMGALGRIIAFLRICVPGQKAVQVLLICVGFGIFVTGLGAATMAILPPLLVALGYGIPSAILLACLGYVGMCMYALLGIPAVILATFTGQGLYETGVALAAFMPAISTCVAFACLHVAGGFTLMRQGFWPACITGLSSGCMAILLARLGLLTLTATISGLTIMLALLIYVKITRGRLYDASLYTEQTGQLSLLRACSPWLILMGISFVMNAPALPLWDIVFRQFSMPVEIIPHAPERIRLFWQAYFWVIVSTFISLPFLRTSATKFQAACHKSLHRAWRPFVATVIYFAIAYVMNHSGKNAQWLLADTQHNMILLIANSTTQLLGAGYPLAAPYLGLLAGFISGSASSAVAMLTKLQLAVADTLHTPGLLLAASSSIGGGLASAMSPSKLLSAAATIDAPKAANSVIPYAFVLTCCITAVCALLTYFWA